MYHIIYLKFCILEYVLYFTKNGSTTLTPSGIKKSDVASLSVRTYYIIHVTFCQFFFYYYYIIYYLISAACKIILEGDPTRLDLIVV